MTTYHLCIAWNCADDADFVSLLNAVCRRRGMTTVEITPANLHAGLQAVAEGRLRYRAFLNRAADTDPRFLPLVHWADQQGALSINPLALEQRSADKATMHLEFIAHGLPTPHTIVLPPYAAQPWLPPPDLTPLDGSFAIKPANGSGGRGVFLEATSWDQVVAARQQYPHDKYLLQAHVEPAQLDGRPAWFRVIYCVGQVYLCWWPPQTRVYAPVSPTQERDHGLAPLRTMAQQIAALCGLHLFSTEIALTADGRFLAVDYVNDQIDLRLKSKAPDGVPDLIVADIAERLADLIAAFSQ